VGMRVGDERHIMNCSAFISGGANSVRTTDHDESHKMHLGLGRVRSNGSDGSQI